MLMAVSASASAVLAAAMEVMASAFASCVCSLLLSVHLVDQNDPEAFKGRIFSLASLKSELFN